MQLTLHITSLEGRGIPLTGRFDRLFLVGAVGGAARSSGAAGKRSASGTITWPSGAGEVSWRLGDTKQFARLEAASPTVRINLVARSSAPQQHLEQEANLEKGERRNDNQTITEETYIGYVLLPLKSLEKRSAIQTVGGFEQWLPIAGAGPGAALRLRACIVETMETKSPESTSSSSTSMNAKGRYLSTSSTAPSGEGVSTSVIIENPVDEEETLRRGRSSSGGGGGGDANNKLPNVSTNKSRDQADVLLSSKETFADENSDAISIGNRGNSLFDLNIRIGGVRGLAAALGAQRYPLPTGQLWLSYSLFGVLVQTSAVNCLAELEDEFGGGLEPFTDTFTMRSCLPDLSLFLAALQPVQVLLCAPGEVIAQTEISLSQLLQGLPPLVLPKCSNGTALTFSSPTSVDELDLAEPTNAELAAIERTFEGAEMEGEFPLRLSVANHNNSYHNSSDLRSQLSSSGTLHAYVSLISRNGGMPGALIPPQGYDGRSSSFTHPHHLMEEEKRKGDGGGGGQSEASRALESMKDLVAGLIASGRLGDALANGQNLAATMPPSLNNGIRGVAASNEPKQTNSQTRTVPASSSSSSSSSSSYTAMHQKRAHEEPLPNLDATKELGPSVQAGLLLLSPIKIQVDEIQVFDKNVGEKEEEVIERSRNKWTSIPIPRRTLHLSYESLFVPPASVLSMLGVSAEGAGHCIKQEGDLRVCSNMPTLEENSADENDANDDQDGVVTALVLHVPSQFQVSSSQEAGVVTEDQNQNKEITSSITNGTSSSSTLIPVEPSGTVTLTITLESHSNGSTSLAYARIPAAALVQAAKMSSNNNSASGSLVSVNLVEGGERNGSDPSIIGTILLRISSCEDAEEHEPQNEETKVSSSSSSFNASSSSSSSSSSPLPATNTYTSSSSLLNNNTRIDAPGASSSLHNDGNFNLPQDSVNLLSTVRSLREEVDSERRTCASLRLEVEIERRRADAAESRQREEVEERARERRSKNEAEDECVRLRNRLADAERARDEAERSLSLARSEAVGLNSAIAAAESRALMLTTSSLQQQDGSSSTALPSTSVSMSPPPPQPAAPAAASILAALQNQILPPQTLDELLRDHPALRIPAEKMMARLKAEAEASVSEWQRNRESDWIAAKAKAEAEWRKEEAEREEKRMTAMEGAWAEREAERQAILVEAQERVREVESRVRKLLTGAEQKMKEAERAKEDAAKMLEGHKLDLAAMQRRVREDGEHVMSQARAREAAVERRVHDAEAEAVRLRETVKMLELQAVEAKKKEATSPETGLRDAMAIATVEVDRMRKEVEKKEAEMEEMKTMRDTALVQVIRLAKEVGRLRDQIEAQRVVEAEKLRIVYLVGEERLALDGDRERLREIKRDVEKVRKEVEKEVEKEGGRQVCEVEGTAEVEAAAVVSTIAAMTTAAAAATTTTSQASTETNENENIETLNGAASVINDEKNQKINEPEGTSESAIETAIASSSAAMKAPSTTIMTSTTSASNDGVSRGVGSNKAVVNRSPPVPSSSPPGGDSIVRRLKAERKALLDAGAGYSVSHPLVKRIDRALAEASGRLGGASGGI